MSEPWHRGLTEKQRRFCEAYAANGGNATDAARQAGYAKPVQQGPRLLGNVGVQQALEALRQETTSQAIADREERQAFWTSIMRGEPTRDGEAPQIKDRIKAAELLGKSQGDFIERRELTGSGGGAVQIEPGKGISALLAAAEQANVDEGDE